MLCTLTPSCFSPFLSFLFVIIIFSFRRPYIYWQRRFSFSCHRLIFSVATPLDSFHSLFSLRRGKDTDDNGPTELTKVSLFVLIFCCVAFLFTRFPQNKHLLPPKSSTQALRVALLIKNSNMLLPSYSFCVSQSIQPSLRLRIPDDDGRMGKCFLAFLFYSFNFWCENARWASCAFSPSSVRLLFILFLSLRWQTAAAGIRKKIK